MEGYYYAAVVPDLSTLGGDKPHVPRLNRRAIALSDPRCPLTALAPTSATATGTTSEIVAANIWRGGLFVTNTSAVASVSLAFGFPAVINNGITLAPGGIFHMDDFDFTTAAVNAIASAGSVSLAIQEFNY